MAARKKKDMAADGPGDGVQPAHGGEAVEVSDEVTQVVEYAAGIDVAKGFGMVCTRVPGSRPGRTRQKVWRVNATFTEVTALMDHLVCAGIQRLVLESTSDYWRIWYYLAEAAGPGGLAGQRPRRQAPAGPGQERPAGLHLAVQAERAGDAAPLVRAAAGGAGPADADPHPVPAGPGPGPAPGPGGEDPRRRAAEGLQRDLRPVRRVGPPVPGRPHRRGAVPCGAGRPRRLPAQSQQGHADRGADRPVP